MGAPFCLLSVEGLELGGACRPAPTPHSDPGGSLLPQDFPKPQRRGLFCCPRDRSAWGGKVSPVPPVTERVGLIRRLGVAAYIKATSSNAASSHD